ncbi:hypothetical protein BAZ12_19585 [Elizabethkingia miricola]|uniref:hypothetical protein n=1 Tax=Elizabethkingia miricola TaxID=172045 RepID=UPI000999A0F1|nr:hypothetical protein [Elizabethkingia miricola]OPC76214.1 hypothetical protein BAZ12_19585 [Elizabethkingia miricola]
MKAKQLIVSVLGLSTILACSSDRDQETTNTTLRTSTSVKSIRYKSDTLKPIQSQKNGITTKAASDGEEASQPIDGSETIDPTKSGRPK